MSAALPVVFLVDDDPFQLAFLGGILRARGHRVEPFDHPQALLSRLSPEDRGCVVLDLEMPGLSGLELQKSLGDRGVRLPLVFVSGHGKVPAVVTAMKQGALDFLSKPIQADALSAAVEDALRRDAAAALDRGVRAEARARWESLSAREKEVCLLFAQGRLDKQIAADLGLAPSTVQQHRTRALAKLGAISVADVVHLRRQAEQDGD